VGRAGAVAPVAAHRGTRRPDREGRGERRKKLTDEPELALWFRLALAWGCPVAEAQERCSSDEFTYWKAFAAREPFGGHADNWRAALISSTVANTIPRKQGARAFTPDDFMPHRDDRGSRSDLTEEQRRFIESQRKSRGKRRHNHR
jgi:hypothetical protein